MLATKSSRTRHRESRPGLRLCARVEVGGVLHDIDVVPQAVVEASGSPPLKILVDGRVIHGDASTSPRSLIEPPVWAHVRGRGFWSYALGESPKGILLLSPAFILLVLFGFELLATILLGLVSSWVALVGLPGLTWLGNERRWRMRQRRLDAPHRLPSVALHKPPDAA